MRAGSTAPANRTAAAAPLEKISYHRRLGKLSTRPLRKGLEGCTAFRSGDVWLFAPRWPAGGDFDGDGCDKALVAVVCRDTGDIDLHLGNRAMAGSRRSTRFKYPGYLTKELPVDNGNSKSGTGRGFETEFLGLDMTVGDFFSRHFM